MNMRVYALGGVVLKRVLMPVQAKQHGLQEPSQAVKSTSSASAYMPLLVYERVDL